MLADKNARRSSACNPWGVFVEKADTATTAGPGYVPILRAGNIGEVLKITNDLVWVPETILAQEQFLKRHDVAILHVLQVTPILSENLTTPFETGWRGSVGAFCAIIRFTGLHPRFGAYWLRSPGFKVWRDGQAQGANTQNLRKAQLEQIEIPIPPLSEQERIVRILDEAEALRRLRTRTDSRTIELLSSLFEKTFGRHICSPPVVVSINGLSAPEGWRWARLTNVARLATGHTPSRQVPSYWGGSLPWISLSDIRALDGKIALTASEFVTKEGIQHSSAVQLPKDTVSFSNCFSWVCHYDAAQKWQLPKIL